MFRRQYYLDSHPIGIGRDVFMVTWRTDDSKYNGITNIKCDIYVCLHVEWGKYFTNDRHSNRKSDANGECKQWYDMFGTVIEFNGNSSTFRRDVFMVTRRRDNFEYYSKSNDNDYLYGNLHIEWM